MKILLIIGTICAIALIIGAYFLGRKTQKDELRFVIRGYDWYNETFLSKQGGTQNVPSYHLMSFDSGQSWYAVDQNDKGFKIVGPAEDIFPGLLAHLKATDDLIKYVETNGPITFSDTTMEKDVEILEGAGFEVKTN